MSIPRTRHVTVYTYDDIACLSSILSYKTSVRKHIRLVGSLLMSVRVFLLRDLGNFLCAHNNGYFYRWNVLQSDVWLHYIPFSGLNEDCMWAGRGGGGGAQMSLLCMNLVYGYFILPSSQASHSFCGSWQRVSRRPLTPESPSEHFGMMSSLVVTVCLHNNPHCTHNNNNLEVPYTQDMIVKWSCMDVWQWLGIIREMVILTVDM